jgi:hypothetical protein
MALAACWVLVVALGATPDISHLFHFSFQQGQPADPEKAAPQGTLPPATSEPPAEKQQGQASADAQVRRDDHLSEGSRLAIIRAISGEFVRAQVGLPGGKEGFHLDANQPAVHPAVHPANSPKQDADLPVSSHVLVVSRAPVIHQGDQVQITRVEFRDKSIVLDLNGGGKQRWHLKDHLQIATASPIPTATVDSGQPGPGGLEGQGTTIFLDFGRKLPDLSPDELKQKLAPILDFSAHRSAAAQYAESLPTEFQQAIKNGVAAVGMDHEMVLAAMGRPDRKVRERDGDGNDTEDWIYGNPPGKTVFVTFIGEKVARVRQFN